MIAAVMREVPTARLDVDDIDQPVPGPGEVLVEVRACGICGTDLHIMDGESYRPELPFVLGHELVGTVVAAGDEAGRAWVGREVVPTLFVGCGRCAPCRHGDERLCEPGAAVVGVVGRPGGFAGFVSLRTSQLVGVPDGVPSTVAASLVDAGATARNAARIALGPSAYGEAHYLVVGGGPVGLLVAELLMSCSKRTVVVEGNKLRLSVLAERGIVALPSLSDVDEVFTTVVDCSGAAELVGPELELLAPRGRYLAVGYSKPKELDLSVVSRRELTIRGIRSGKRSDLEEVLALVSSGELAPPPVTTWPLGDINEAVKQLREGRVIGKAVVINASAKSE